jgi:hypothetical protein
VLAYRRVSVRIGETRPPTRTDTETDTETDTKPSASGSSYTDHTRWVPRHTHLVAHRLQHRNTLDATKSTQDTPRTPKAGWPAIWPGNGCKDPCRAACARGRNPDRGYPTFVAQFELGNQASWVLYQETLANIGQGCCPGCCPSPRTGALGCPGGVSQHPETVPIMRGYRC